MWELNVSLVLIMLQKTWSRLSEVLLLYSLKRLTRMKIAHLVVVGRRWNWHVHLSFAIATWGLERLPALLYTYKYINIYTNEVIRIWSTLHAAKIGRISTHTTKNTYVTQYAWEKELIPVLCPTDWPCIIHRILVEQPEILNNKEWVLLPFYHRIVIVPISYILYSILYIFRCMLICIYLSHVQMYIWIGSNFFFFAPILVFHFFDFISLFLVFLSCWIFILIAINRS